MKIMVLLSRVPYPLEKGDKLRAFHQVRHLAQQHEIVLVCLNDSELHPKALEVLEPLCSEVHIIQLSRLALLKNLFFNLFSKRPFQVSYFYHPTAQQKIDELIARHLPKHIYCQLVRVTEYVRKYTVIPKTLDYMDALSMGAKRRIEGASFWLRPFLQMEARRLAAYEAEIFGSFQHHTIISKQDRELIEHPGKGAIAIIPNGVDMEQFSPLKREKDFELVFTGNMSYPPNVDSAIYLATEILPLVQREIPGARLLISGVNPSRKVRALASDSVVVTGWVEDIRDSYARSQVFIAPMQIGTGLQNKLLEAMAMQIPCITSPLANNALQAKPGEEVLVGETPEQYATHVVNLLHDKDLQDKIARNGHQFLCHAFDWGKKTTELEQLMEQSYVM